MTDASRHPEPRRSRIVRWLVAAAVVCALHVGGVALTLMHWHEQEAEDAAAGALTVELAPLPAAPPVDSPHVAPGPEQQQAKLTHDAAKPVAEKVVKDIPHAAPSPAPEPDVALPKPQPEEREKPKQQQEPEESAQREQTPQQDAEVTTAPPKVEVQPAPRSAPSPGQSASLARVQARWQKSLVRHLERHIRYPAAAEQRGVRGVVVVRFGIDRSGQVVSSEILKSSGSQILDEEALATLKRASPLPVPSDEIPDPLLDNSMPITFK